MKTAPAYMLYASDTIADRRYRMMSLEERGLHFSIQNECWVNRSAPADPDALAKLLGYTVDEVKPALTKRVQAFYNDTNGELTSPELERYRQQLEERRLKESKGGKKGAASRWNKATNGDSPPNGHPNGVSVGSRVEKSREEKITSESLSKHQINNSWVDDYEKASNGG